MRAHVCVCLNLFAVVDRLQYILSQRLGESDFVGKGYWRHVYRVNYEGQDMALKILNEDQEETRRNKERHRWEAVAMNEVDFFCLFFALLS